MATLGLGTATLIPGYGLGAVARVPGDEILRHALRRGIGYLDTAGAYADAEDVIGAVAAEPGCRAARVATKIAAEPGMAPGEIERLAHASLARLGMPQVDTILLHNGSARHFADPGVQDGMRRLTRTGLAARTGASTYGSDDAAAALAADWCDVLQVEFSILNQSVLATVRDCRSPRQEIVARSVLCKGLLAGRHARVAGLADEVREAIEDVRALAEEWRTTLPGAALRFALDAPGVDVVVVGVSSIEEVDAALAVADGASLSPDQWSRLAALDRSAFDVVHPERWGSAAR